jgi:hypothetical protein
VAKTGSLVWVEKNGKGWNLRRDEAPEPVQAMGRKGKSAPASRARGNPKSIDQQSAWGEKRDDGAAPPRKLELENIGNYAKAEGFGVHLFETGALLQIV